jgi:hypothetical protein
MKELGKTRSLLADWLRSVGSYAVLTVVGLLVILLASSAVGYLPYSDRPGPGWMVPTVSIEMLLYFGSWAIYLVVPCAVLGTGVFGYHRLLRRVGAPLHLARVTGGLMGGLGSLWMVAAWGWYIALAAFVPWVAAALGLFWGAFVLPRYLGELPGVARGHWWARVAVAMLPFPVFGLIWLSATSGQNLEIEVVEFQRADSAVEDAWAADLDSTRAVLFDSLALKGRFTLRGSSTQFGGVSDSASMVVVLTRPLRREAQLPIPDGVAVTYVLLDGEWLKFPPDAPTLRTELALGVARGSSWTTIEWPNRASGR